eukprot:m.257260 g.257260  ORF g.257260 m.257260 type:complete len:508 (-) comp35103_c0_seq1:145-1668(-)
MADNHAAQQRALLVLLEPGNVLNTEALAVELKCEHQEVVGLIKSLQAIDADLFESKTIKEVSYACTEEGSSIVANGATPEATAFSLVPTEGISKPDLDKLLTEKGLGSHALGPCMKNKWLKVAKDKSVSRSVESIDDTAFRQLKFIADTPEQMDDTLISATSTVTSADMKDLLRRKLVKKVHHTTFNLSKGPTFTLEVEKPTTDLTVEMLQDDSWKTAKFRKFNLNAEPPITAGALHPLLKVRAEFRQIFLEMGFDEMPTNQYVESSFWNFDALFQPQQHPARDAHDTFFLTQPETSGNFPPEYVEKVKKMHEEGGYGSIGYRYNWSLAEAQKNILRTHTTAVSTRMLYQIGMQKPFKPCKFFSIDRVFRNEDTDATHLAEFHQCEGVVADYNLTLGHLIGVISNFFEKLGMKDVKFKPAYNPYTEPSMEIFAYHPDLKKEVEIGNSGIFRPEMLRPMGLPEDVQVIAWGLSVERPTMIKYDYDDIRKLFGSGVDLQMVRDNPICQL